MSKLRDLCAAPFMLIALTAMWIACFIHDDLDKE